jgi:hypothetical protein
MTFKKCYNTGTRTNGVHPDVKLGQLLGGGAGEPDDASLRCRVVSLPGITDLTWNRVSVLDIK